MDFILYEQGIDGLYEAVLTSDRDFVPSPAPEPFKDAVERAFKGLKREKGNSSLYLHFDGPLDQPGVLLMPDQRPA